MLFRTNTFLRTYKHLCPDSFLSYIIQEFALILMELKLFFVHLLLNHSLLRKPPTIRVSPSVGHFPLNHQSSCPIKGHPAKSFTTLRKPPTISVSPSVGQFPLNHQSRCPPRDTLSPKNQALPLKK